MPHKKKRLFTKDNSTKFVLYTDGRDENGEKIQQNVLVPVPRNHVPGSSLLFSSMPGFFQPNDDKPEEEMVGKENPKPSRRNETSEFASDKEPDLEKILGQMEDSSDSDDEEFDNLRLKMNKFGAFEEPKSSVHCNSNVLIEILDEGSEFSDDFGQFSDAESDDDFGPKSACNLTSSKSNCPESLKILNEGFEKVFEEYEDDQIGALDDEEICGAFSTENEHMQNFINTPLEKEKEIVIGDCDENLKKKILLYTEVEYPEHIIEIKTEKPLEFDCESIISTYSNKYNHPVVIKEESKIRKIRIPDNPLQKRLTKSQLKQLDSASESEKSDDDDDDLSVASCNVRRKGERPEQRKERKALFKEAMIESRKLKKENKLAFKNEKKIQNAQAMNTRNNMGIKLI